MNLAQNLNRIQNIRSRPGIVNRKRIMKSPAPTGIVKSNFLRSRFRRRKKRCREALEGVELKNLLQAREVIPYSQHPNSLDAPARFSKRSFRW